MKTALACLALCLGCFATTARSQNDTFFIAHPDDTLADATAVWTQPFTIKKTRTFVLRFAPDLPADAAVFKDKQLTAFTSGETFHGFGQLKAKSGTKTLTLAPGSYYVGVRNRAAEVNAFSLELDKPLNVPYPWQFYDTLFQNTASVADGALLWQAFRMQRDVRLFLDGCNSGLEVYIIKADQLEAFKSGADFIYYPEYSGTAGELPGYSELQLKPGLYYLCFRNRTGISKAVTYTCQRYVNAP